MARHRPVDETDWLNLGSVNALGWVERCNLMMRVRSKSHVVCRRGRASPTGQFQRRDSLRGGGSLPHPSVAPAADADAWTRLPIAIGGMKIAVRTTLLILRRIRAML
jgi:hypothetical protein